MKCIFEKNQPSSEKLWYHYNFVFPVIPVLGIKFWVVYYYSELGFYYYLLPCNNHLLKLFYEMKGGERKSDKKPPSYIGIINQLPWFLNFGISQRKTHIGQPLIFLQLIIEHQ